MSNSKASGKVQGVHLETVVGVLLTGKFLLNLYFGNKTEQHTAGDARRGRNIWESTNFGKIPAVIAIG
jgi:hypothetical protein